MKIPANIPRLPKRQSNSHKGTYGRVLLVVGSRAYQGAGVLATLGCLRGGAGLVHVAFPESLYNCYAIQLKEAILHPLAETNSGALSLRAFDEIMDISSKMNCVAVGPGLSLHPSTILLAKKLFSSLKVTSVFDADAINSLAVTQSDLHAGVAVRIITPHPREFSRLVEANNFGKQLGFADLSTVREFAKKNNITIVYKSSKPIVSNGEKSVTIESGSSALATGGTGDILTGLISALVYRFSDSFDAAVLGTYLHGRAGTLAGEELTKDCVIASDVLSCFSLAFKGSQLEE